MTNPDETIKFDITETGPDTIEARSSDGEIISGMTWGEFEKRIAQSPCQTYLSDPFIKKSASLATPTLKSL